MTGTYMQCPQFVLGKEFAAMVSCGKDILPLLTERLEMYVLKKPGYEWKDHFLALAIMEIMGWDLDDLNSALFQYKEVHGNFEKDGLQKEVLRRLDAERGNTASEG